MKKVCFSRRQILRTIRAACIALFFAACAQRAGAQSYNHNDFSVNGTTVTDRGVNDPTGAFFSGSGTYNVSIGNVSLGNNAGILVEIGNGSVTTAGNLTGSSYAIKIDTNGTATNSGQITSHAGIYIVDDGTVNNLAGASITGRYNIFFYGAATVNNAGTLTATSTGSVYINSGTVNNSSTGQISSQSSYGVYIGGDGTVNNAGTISGTTSGNNQFGAVHIVGGGGASSVTNTGSITDSSSGYYAAGVVLGTPTINDDSSFTLTNNNIISGTANDATFLAAGYGVSANSRYGNISLTNNGTITGSATSGSDDFAHAFGISASSYEGNVTVANTDMVTGTATALYNGNEAQATADGISASSTYGNVRVTNSGQATSTASGYYTSTASGIYGYTHDGHITITNSGQASGTASAYDFDSGTVAKGYGISASSYYGDGNITITNNGSATGSAYATASGGTASGYGYGVYTISDDGSISITNTGTATGTGSGYYSATGAGLWAYSNSGSVTIQNSGTATGTANSDASSPHAYGIYAETDGPITIVNSGTATASATAGIPNFVYYATSSAYASGIRARSSGSGYVQITNTGTASGTATVNGSGSAYGYGANVIVSGSANVSLMNSGTLTGSASSYVGTASGYGAWIQTGSGTLSVTNTITGVIQGTGFEGAFFSQTLPSPIGLYLVGGTGPATITNSGTISAYYGVGIYAKHYDGDTTVNEIGGWVTTTGSAYYSTSYDAIHLGGGTNTVNMVGQVNNTGLVDGGSSGNNTLTLKLAGMTPAQKVALQQAVINSQGGNYSGAVFAGGVTYSWVDFNFVSGSFVSLEQVVDPGLLDVATKIDNLSGPLPVALGPLLVDAATNPEAALNNFTGREFLNAFVVQGLSQSTALAELGDSRADDLRLGSNGLDFSALNVTSGSMIASLGNTESILSRITSDRIGGTTMSDSKEVDVTPSSNSRLAAWVAGTVTIADEDNTGTNPGFTATSGSPSVGIDYRVCNDLVFGGLFDFTTAGANFSDGSRLNSDTELFGLYADWVHDHWFVNTLVAGGFSSYDQARTTLAGTQALASPDGDEIIANVTSGYDFKVAGFVISPDIGLLYTHLEKDSFSESGGGAFDLNVGEQDVDSLRTKLGFHATRPFSWDAIKFTPEMHATWYHECLDDTNNVNTSVPGAPVLPAFQVTTNPQGRDFAAVGAGLSATPAEWHDNVTFFVNYDAQVGQDNYTANTVDGGLRVNF